MGHLDRVVEMLNPVLLSLAWLGVAIGVMRFAVDHPLIENGLVGVWSALGVVYLLLWLRELRPARRIMRRGQRTEEARAERTIDAMRRLPFIASVQYHPRTGRVSGGLGVRPTWRKRAVEAVLWLANHRMLPRCVTIWTAERLGWKYEGVADE